MARDCFNLNTVGDDHGNVFAFDAVNVIVRYGDLRKRNVLWLDTLMPFRLCYTINISLTCFVYPRILQ